MVHDVIDIVLNIFWTGIFIGLGMVSYVGLRNVVMAVRHKTRRGWTKSLSRKRVVSRRFAVAYICYGLSFSLTRAIMPDEHDGWIGVAGYMLVLLHILTLRVIHERELLNARP